MYSIGLTGNIGCGKSTVLRMLQAFEARVIDADKLAHQVMEPNTPAWRAIVDAFGATVVAPDGRIDRPALGRIVFANPPALRRLEEIVHPAVDREIRAQLATATEPIVVVEAIKLVEVGLHKRLDALWVVTCTREQQIQRLVEQRGMSEETAVQRIDAQGSIEDKLALANVVIDNSGSLDDAWRQVQAALVPVLGQDLVRAVARPTLGE